MSDFSLDAELREAFHRLAAEHAAINPNEVGNRLANQRRRARKHEAIDAYLDAWLERETLEPFEADVRTNPVEIIDPAPTPVARPTYTFPGFRWND